LLSGRADYADHQGKAAVRFADVLDSSKAEIEKALAIHCPSPDYYSNDDRESP
jgi:hypothetical protein